MKLIDLNAGDCFTIDQIGRKGRVLYHGTGGTQVQFARKVERRRTRPSKKRYGERVVTKRMVREPPQYISHGTEVQRKRGGCK